MGRRQYERWRPVAGPPSKQPYLVVSWIRETTAADGGDHLKNVRMRAYRLDLDIAADVPYSLTPVGGGVKLISNAWRTPPPAATARWGPAVAGFPTDAGMGADVMIGILQWDDGDQFWPTWSYYAVAVPAAASDVPRVFAAYSGKIQGIESCPKKPGDPAPSDSPGVYGRFVKLEGDAIGISYLQAISGESDLAGVQDNSPASALEPDNTLDVTWHRSWVGTDNVGADMRGAFGQAETADSDWTLSFLDPPGGRLFGNGEKNGCRDCSPVVVALPDGRVAIACAWHAQHDQPHIVKLDLEAH